MLKKIVNKITFLLHHKGIRISLVITSWLVFFILGSEIRNKIVKNKPGFYEERNQFGNKFINPLLECNGINLDFALPYFISLKHMLTDYVAKEEKLQPNIFTSVYFRDLNNGTWIGIKEKELFSPASLIKVPLLITYLKKVESNPDILDKKIKNTQELNIKQNYPPEEQLEQNKWYSVKELLDQMIIYSDNQAYDLLLKNSDSRDLTDTYFNLGVDVSKSLTDPFGNIVSVKDYASFFRILYNASYLNQEMSEKTLLMLSKTSFKKGLVAGVPKNIIVSHKYGERFYLDSNEAQLHDCGIIYLPQNPYLLCVMTRGKSFADLENIIKEISKNVYGILSNSKK